MAEYPRSRARLHDGLAQHPTDTLPAAGVVDVHPLHLARLVVELAQRHAADRGRLRASPAAAHRPGWRRTRPAARRARPATPASSKYAASRSDVLRLPPPVPDHERHGTTAGPGRGLRRTPRRRPSPSRGHDDVFRSKRIAVRPRGRLRRVGRRYRRVGSFHARQQPRAKRGALGPRLHVVRGAGGNRTRVLKRRTRSSPGAVCIDVFSVPALAQTRRRRTQSGLSPDHPS